MWASGTALRTASASSERGGEEELCPGGGERRRDLLDAEPIGVGLDHGAGERALADAVERLPVALDRAEIDREAAPETCDSSGRQVVQSRRSGR